MRKIPAALLLVLLTVFVSCEPETMLTVDQTSLSFTDTGGSRSITLTANKVWSASSNQSWCKVSPAGGQGSVDNNVTINCEPNTAFEPRSCTVTFTSVDMRVIVNVKQAEGKGIEVSQSEFELTKDAQSFSFEVRSNVVFNTSISGNWISYESTKGMTTNKLTFSVTKNESYDIRSGSITLSEKDGHASTVVKVKQGPEAGLQVDSSDYTVYGDEQKIKVGVKTNVDLEIRPDVDWIKHVETKALSSKEVILEIAKNQTQKDRTGKVAIKQKNGQLGREIFIHQKADSYDSPIVFADEKVKTKLVEAFDTNKDEELSYREAAAISSIEGVFGAIKTYTSFDEFQYFTGVREIPESMFEGWRLTSIILPENIVTIEKAGFRNCSSLSNIILNNNLEKINDECFFGCSGLTSISLNSGLMSIGNYAFMGCSRLSSIIIPKGTTIIGAQAFSDCVELTSAIIEEGITSIEQGTFYNCRNLSYVSIPPTVQVIKSRYLGTMTWRWRGAFSRCSSLRKIDLPNSIVEIDSGTFRGSGLTSIIIPDSVTSLGSFAFAECKSLISVTLKSGLSGIEGGTFYECSRLEMVSISDCVTEIKDKGHDLEATPTNYYYGCFENCTSLKQINLPANLTSIGTNAFYNCTSLTDISIPHSVKSLRSGAFSKCSSLSYISIPESVSEIGSGLFYECVALTNIDLPESIMSIAPNMFQGCTGLKSITIPESVTIIDYYAFYGCSSLSSVKISNNVTEIRDVAFCLCSNLALIELPNNLEKINKGAFAGCKNLTSITVPPKVSVIYDDAFNACSSFGSITLLPVNPPSLMKSGSVPFYTDNNYPLYVPLESLDKYRLAEGWKEVANRIQAIPE